MGQKSLEVERNWHFSALIFILGLGFNVARQNKKKHGEIVIETEYYARLKMRTERAL
jgi:hypothetical protein